MLEPVPPDRLKQLAAAGAAAAFTPITIRGQGAPIRIAGMPVEIAIASVSPVTVRITVAAIVGTGGVPDDGALVAAAEGKPLARRRRAEAFTAVRAGNLTVRYSPDPPAIHVETVKGEPCSGWSSTSIDLASGFSCRRDRCSVSARAGRSSIARDQSIGCGTVKAGISSGRTAGGCRSSG